MRFRDHVALTIPPLAIRLVLALTFLYAGLGKLLGDFQVQGEDAARLVNLGVALNPVESAGGDAEPTRPIADPELPEELDADQGDIPVPSEPPTELIIPEGDDPADDADIPEPETDPAPDPIEDTPALTIDTAALSYDFVQVQGTAIAGAASADDFREPMMAQRLHGITLLLSKSADPPLGENSQPKNRTVPQWVGASPWPTTLAWVATITELLAAVLLLFGVLTRLGGLMVFGVMLNAMWLTQFGPAALQSNDAILGFIPAFADPWNVANYAPLLWQLACCVMGLAIALMGSGAIGFDRALFRQPEKLERTDEPPKRDSFDRTVATP